PDQSAGLVPALPKLSGDGRPWCSSGRFCCAAPLPPTSTSCCASEDPPTKRNATPSSSTSVSLRWQDNLRGCCQAVNSNGLLLRAPSHFSPKSCSSMSRQPASTRPPCSELKRSCRTHI